MESVKFTYRVYDNILEITPVDGVQDNSIYTFRIKNLKSINHDKVLDSASIDINTAMIPCYCSIDSIKALVDVFDIPESTIFYFIRSASREADFINGKPVDISRGVPYPVEKFVEVKATLEALTRAYITGGSQSGLEGTLGKITFKNGDKLSSIRTLINDLKKEAKKWQDAIRGYVFEGRNKPSYALRGNHSFRATPVAVILNNYFREGNQGIKEGVII